MELSRVGIWSMQLGRMPAAAVRQTVAEIEALGFRAVWYPETLAKETMSQAALLLAAGSEGVVASGVANIWARDPVAMMNGARTLAEADRLDEAAAQLQRAVELDPSDEAAKRNLDQVRRLHTAAPVR